MHELSIALEIVNIAEEEAVKAGVEKFSGIELEIGSLSGIEIDALNFVWDSAVKESVLDGAGKQIDIVQGEAKCTECESIFELDFIHEPCPNCGGFRKEILSGKELKVKNLLTS